MRMSQAIYRKDGGWQNLPDPREWDHPNTLIIAFCARYFLDDHKPIEELARQFPKSAMAGCSTSGEIQGDEISDFSIVVSFVHFENGTVRVANLPIENVQMSARVGFDLARQINGPNLKGVSIFSDGLNANGSKLIDGFNEGMEDKSVVIGGGLAGDGNDFQRTFTVFNGKVYANHVCAVGFYGETMEVVSESRGVCDIFGPERVVTRSQGNVVFEIDGRPALDLYKEYLGEKASELPASGLFFPLQVSPADDSEKKLVRTMLAVDEDAKSITFAGDVPQGWNAQLMRANFERVIDGAGKAAQVAVDRVPKEDDSVLVIAVSCVGRRLVLGERTIEEVEAIGESLPKGSQVIGFYSYGELSPSQAGKSCELHNQTMTVLMIRERKQESMRSAA
ncbi:MAG: FIST signal transduction protein [Bdellovibrionales bacterium]